MKATITHLQGVETIEVSSGKSEVGVVFLHGYGANMRDLYPLWEMWHRPGFSWYFPNGIESLPMGYYEGRAWFSIDMVELDRAMREGRHRDMKHFIPPELDSTLNQLELYLSEISKRHDKIILGGFSQGAMCSSHLATKANLKIEALVLLSGALLAEKKFPGQARGIPFYQSHGANDPVLSIEGAKDLEKKLLELGFKGKLQTFKGGHEIPSSVIQEVKTFLGEL